MVFPLVLLSVPSRLLDQYSVSFVPHVDSRPAAFVLSIQVTKVTIFSHSLRDVSSKLLCDHKSITLPVLFTFLHPIFFSTVLTLPLSFLILPSLFQLVPC